MNNKKTVLVVGGAGFVGSQVAKTLKNNSIDYEVLSRKECDLLSLEEVEKCLLPYKSKNLDVLFTASILGRSQDPKTSLQDNILMVSNFIKSVSDHNINSFIYISSIDVYFNNGFKIDESSLLCPKNHYSISKICCEAMLKSIFNDKLTILRLPGIYGINDGGSIIEKFTNLIKNNEPLKLINKGSQFRDYLYVGDVSRAVLKLLKSPCSGVFNLSSGESLKLIQITSLISKELNQEALIEKSLSDSSSEVDIYISNKKFLNEYPDFSFTSMESGIKQYIKEKN